MGHARRLGGARGTWAVSLPALLLAALAWAGAIAFARFELEAGIAGAYRQNANLALAFEQHALGTIRAVDQALQLVMLGPTVGGVPGPVAVERVRGLGDGLLLSLLVADAAGNVVGDSRAFEAVNLSGRDFFVHHRDHEGGGALVSAPIAGRLSGRYVIPMSRRLEAPDGSFAGIVAAGIDPHQFVEYYHQMELGHSAMAELVGLDGVIRVRRTGTYVSSGQDAGASSLLANQAKANHGNFLSAGHREGVPRYTSYRTLPGFGLVVAVGTAEDDILAAHRPLRNAAFAAAGAFTLTVAAAAGLVLVVMRRRRRFLAQTLRGEAQFRATFHQAAIGIAHVALDGRFLKVNEALCRMIGFTEAQLLQRSITGLVPAGERAVVEGELAALPGLEVVAPLERGYIRADGTVLRASVATAVVRDPEGYAEYFVAMVQDIGERVAAQEKVLRQAQFDPLTDLPNRALFADRLGVAISHARRRCGIAAVMFIDLDGFKAVNDGSGHAAGDVVLREVASRLAATLRTGDTAARVGGDEFAVVLPQLSRPEDAAIVAGKILRALEVPVATASGAHAVTASIGIALFPAHGVEAEELVRHADIAMFEAKQAGKNAYRVHDPGRASRAA